MSGHWPYIIAAYSICFVLFTLDWLASSLALRKFRNDFAMRVRREQNAAKSAQNAPETGQKNHE